MFFVDLRKQVLLGRWGLLGLEALAVVAGRLAEVLGAVAAEVGERGEVHALGDLGERQALVVEKVF